MQNKVEKNIKCFNMDGREFINHLIDNKIEFNHVLMNLPQDAIQFLDVFLNIKLLESRNCPIIHCYTFSEKEDPERDIIEVNI